MLRKFTSRKLWLAIAGVIVGIAMAFGLDESDISTISGAVTAIISIVTYIAAEGRVDAESVKKSIEATKKAIEVIEDGNSK